MFGSQLMVPPLLAQAVESPSTTFLQYLPIVLAVLFFLFISSRSAQQDQRKRKEMLNTLKKNDKVLTTAGFYGTVVAVDPDNDRVTLRISEEGNVRVAFARSGIVRVISDAPEKK